ncbi:hypothetical protein L596_025284 [Steinernema carpocapsae]|uniref:Uncharacterized protein n=1 Tax=Steinernema carpocapsae TaxID=34508 RepID=A0A4V5ZYS0_STECR|nr:hypothetical protein L596_025284 [Steinernema carpocapsae]
MSPVAEQQHPAASGTPSPFPLFAVCTRLNRFLPKWRVCSSNGHSVSKSAKGRGKQKVLVFRSLSWGFLGCIGLM